MYVVSQYKLRDVVALIHVGFEYGYYFADSGIQSLRHAGHYITYEHAVVLTMVPLEPPYHITSVYLRNLSAEVQYHYPDSKTE